MIIRGPMDVTDSPIVIVELSQEADEEIPFRYPWPRWIYAKLIENLNQAGVKAIGFDLLFDQPDDNPGNDSTFAKALAAYDNVVMTGGFRRMRDTRRSGLVSESIYRVMPAPLLDHAMQNPPGIVDMYRDGDGFIRSYPFQSQFRDETLYSLAIQTLMVAENIPADQVSSLPGSFHIGRYGIPKNREKLMYINFYGGNRTFAHIGLEKVIDDEQFDTQMEMEAFPVNEFSDPDYGILARGELEGKIVLVGATMPELQDYHTVPFVGDNRQSTMAGVEIHANALQTIIDENYLRDLPGSVQTLILILLTVYLVWYVNRGRLAISGVTTALFMIFTLAGGYLFFSQWGIIIDILPLLTAQFGAFLAAISANYVNEQSEKKRITSMFLSYVSPDLVKRLIEGDQALNLAGEKKELTVLFCDIANFTKLSEQLPPDEIVEFMNRYLDGLTTVITDEEGTLDKYIGDAIMAFYGAPLALSAHASRACKSALLMRQISDKIIQKIVSENQQLQKIPLYTRFGVNTGKMLVGNVGSSRRFNYTVMGDQVNIGARCEAACKEFGVSIIVSGATRKRAGKVDFLYRPLGFLRVVGREEPVEIYELMAFKKQAEPKWFLLAEKFEKAMELYKTRNWLEAREAFLDLTGLEAERPDNIPGTLNPSQFYADLCEKLSEELPGEEWKGVIDQKIK